MYKRAAVNNPLESSWRDLQHSGRENAFMGQSSQMASDEKEESMSEEDEDEFLLPPEDKLKLLSLLSLPKHQSVLMP